MHRKLIRGDRHCIANCFAVHFEENKLDKEFQINLQNYRQFSGYSTKKIIEKVFNYISIKRHSIKHRHSRQVLICVRLTFTEISC